MDVQPQTHLPDKRTIAADPSTSITAHFREHERFLWGLCYRMTGSAADADDLVQETFLRAMERPPSRTEEPWRPWLVTVAMNLGRDALRKRRRRGYTGPWLPSPIETDTCSDSDTDAPHTEPPSWEASGERSTEGRYDLLESVSFAFLLALEALSPQQRAVLLLRDVFDYSVKETSAALGLSEPNVKTTHHRARRALEPYDAQRCRPTAELAARSQAALIRFLQSLAGEDVAAVEALLAEDARALSDGGGEAAAAMVPIIGRTKVARFAIGIAKHAPEGARYELRTFNGLPGFVLEQTPNRPRMASRFMLRCDIDAEGRITALHSVLAPSKLGRVRPITVAA